jgi:hypothetical protein
MVQETKSDSPHLNSQATPARERWTLPVIVSPIIFVFAGLISAATAFIILNNLPAFGRLWSTPIFSALLIAAPILWCVAVIFHDAVSRGLLKVHAAIFTVVFVVDFWGPHTHASPAYLITLVARAFFVILVGMDLLVAYISYRRAKKKQRRVNDLRFLYVGLSMSAIAGLCLGVGAWSPSIPPRVIASAETVSQERPYCIIVDGVPAKNADDLTGLRMKARYDGDWAYNFHSVLVVKSSTHVDYFNWSYQSGEFESVSEDARTALHLDSLPQCKPEVHFARDW